MEIIEIRSTEEFEKLPESFSLPTEIHILCDGIKVYSNKENGYYIASHSSKVFVYGFSEIQAHDSSQIWAHDFSKTWANDSSRIKAHDFSQIWARDLSQVRSLNSSKVWAKDYSKIRSYDLSQVWAQDYSQVLAFGSSHIIGFGSSHIKAYSSSKIWARDSSQIYVYGSEVEIKELLHNSLLVKIDDVNPVIGKISDTAQIIEQKTWKHTKQSFLDLYPLDNDGYVTLYKVTQKDGTDYYTGKIKYEGKVVCPVFDFNPNRQCGCGLHLSPLPELASMYNAGPIKKCRVHKDNFVVYPTDISKVRCSEVEVIEEYVLTKLPAEGEDFKLDN